MRRITPRKLGVRDAFQMFSRQPARLAGCRAECGGICEAFQAARRGHALAPVTVIHGNYLINMASASDSLIRARSIAAFRKELERAIALGVEYLVTHPGSAKGGSPAAAMATFVESLCQAFR